MLFVEPRFFVFLAVVFAIYWLLRSNAWRKSLLLVGSYIFYGAWDYRFLALIGFTTTVDYVIAARLHRERDRRLRRMLLTGSIITNIGILFFFKYFNFFAGSLQDLGDLLGIHFTATTLNVVLPVGISFYTFQSMSYTIDVFNRKLAPASSFRDYALYVAFFPQLVAGPIVKAREFLPQLSSTRVWGRVDVRACLTLFLFGFIKKACVADNIAGMIDPVFADPSRYDAVSLNLAVMFYAAQIYCDFSGYSDMAIGVAGLLGYRLPPNFDRPYFSGNLTEFWRRWHISLSSWMRDYLYIPMGGSRGTPLQTAGNIMKTMLLGGLWHGASYNFVVWGGLHGAGLVASKHWPIRLPRLLSMALTFYVVCLAWIFFRAESFPDAWVFLNAWVLLSSVGTQSAFTVAAPVTLALLAMAHALAPYVDRLSHYSFSAAYGATAAVALAFVATDAKPFVYFQF